jgi:hypothetical protein
MSVRYDGKNGISVVLIKDSISDSGKRMSTFEIEMPRLILPEWNTHRAVSKNLQSSRAVPFDSAIKMVEESIFEPVHYGINEPGMVSRAEFQGESLVMVRGLWKMAKATTISIAKMLSVYKPHKQWAARILEPYMMSKAVSTATDWDNLIWLRDDDDAQPEIRDVAKGLKFCLENSKPFHLKEGEWHLPYVGTYRDDSGNIHYVGYVGQEGVDISVEDALKISASCCAQISYRKLNDTKEKAIEIYQKLFSGRKPHMSPTEHQGTPISQPSNPFDASQWQDGVTHVDRDGLLHSGNLTGWVQYRQTLPNNCFKG